MPRNPHSGRQAVAGCRSGDEVNTAVIAIVIHATLPRLLDSPCAGWWENQWLMVLLATSGGGWPRPWIKIGSLHARGALTASIRTSCNRGSFQLDTDHNAWLTIVPWRQVPLLLACLHGRARLDVRRVVDRLFQ